MKTQGTDWLALEVLGGIEAGCCCSGRNLSLILVLLVVL